MTTHIYRLPDLLAGCPRKRGPVNPYLAEVNEEHIGWIDNCPTFRAPNDSNACKSAQLPLFMSLMFPKADAKALRAIVNYVTATIILDKINDTATVENAQQFASLYTAAFNNPSEGMKSQHTFVQLISSLSFALNESVGPSYLTDFLRANAAFAQSTVQEAVERKAAQDTSSKLTLETYLATRRDSICIKPYMIFVRSSGGLEIPRDTLGEPAIRGMEEEVINMILIANDIYSYKKELTEDNAPHNLLTVLMQDPPTSHLDLQGAIDYAGKLFESSLNRFKKCQATLPLLDEETNNMVVEYAEGLSDLFVGNIEWSVVVPRYNVFENEEHRQRRWMVL
ncbi:terpenoid synthase [Leucogyrophana mollusca]|uniref:Terpenoid synthase n=1 Tax=Leucogyrophana mollusca TaxID=85980 RepID=A0ACB8BI19_9AGAM|nr:terpenoid synthase [Leucogyrophana mollusca]